MQAVKLVAAVGLVLALGAGALVAQEAQEQPPQRPMRMRMHMPDSAMAGMMMQQHMQMMQGQQGMMRMAPAAGLGPAALIRQRDFLDLTDEQVTRLEALEQEVQQVQEQQREAIQQHAQALREALQADRPDVNAVRQHAQALHEAQGAVHLAALTAHARAKAVLTAEQQGKIRGWMEGRRAGARMDRMRPSRRPGMMLNRPRMRMPGGVRR